MWNAMEGTLKAKSKNGEQKFIVLSKRLEFCRVVYGSDYSKVVVFFLFGCQQYGFSPAHDFPWLLIAKGKLKGWYCAHCGCGYIQNPMACALAIFYKH